MGQYKLALTPENVRIRISASAFRTAAAKKGILINTSLYMPECVVVYLGEAPKEMDHISLAERSEETYSSQEAKGA